MVDFFFNEHDSQVEGDILWRIKKCQQDKKKSGGWTNLLTHLKACIGPDYQAEYHVCLKQNFLSSFTAPSDSKRESDVFYWMEWVVMRNMALAEVDNEITRKGICYHGAITSKLLRKMIFLLQSEVKTKN